MSAPLTVQARRHKKGARVRVLARQAGPHVGLAYYEPGGVSVHFNAGEERVTVFLPPEVVARIRSRDLAAPAHAVPALVADPDPRDDIHDRTIGG